MWAMSAFQGSEIKGPEINYLHVEQLKLQKLLPSSLAKPLL